MRRFTGIYVWPQPDPALAASCYHGGRLAMDAVRSWRPLQMLVTPPARIWGGVFGWVCVSPLV